MHTRLQFFCLTVSSNTPLRGEQGGGVRPLPLPPPYLPFPPLTSLLSTWIGTHCAHAKFSSFSLPPYFPSLFLLPSLFSHLPLPFLPPPSLFSLLQPLTPLPPTHPLLPCPPLIFSHNQFGTCANVCIINCSFLKFVCDDSITVKTSLQQIDFNSITQNPLPCTCPGSVFLYAPCGHIVTGDLSIVQNDKLRDLLRKGPKFREPVSFSWHQNFDIIMDGCKAYARQWAKKEDVELDTLSEWIKSIGEVVKRRIRRLKHSVNTRSESICRDPDVVRELSRLHENFVIVPADKASNNYTFVCKRHYVDILIEELGLHSLPGNPTYNLTDFSASEVLDNHKSVITSFGIQSNSEELDSPYIYWIPKMHKNPYKHRSIAGSSKCSTKPLSILLTKLLTHIKQGLQNRDSLLKKLGQSDVDPQESKIIIRSS